MRIERCLYQNTFANHPNTLFSTVSAQLPDLSFELTETTFYQNINNILDGVSAYWGAGRSYADLYTRTRGAFLRAQTHFAWLDCRAPRHEDSLTGSLMSRLSEAVLSLSSAPNKNPLCLWSIELILKNAEQRLGADVAFVLEGAGCLYATCLQAKRRQRLPQPDGDCMENISQGKLVTDPKTGEKVRDYIWQYGKMQELRNNGKILIDAAYIFYYSDYTGDAILPLVRKIEEIEPAELKQKQVNLNLRCYDLASYICALITSGLSIPDDAQSLIDFVNLIVDNETRRIVCVGSSSDFGYRIKSALDNRCPEHFHITHITLHQTRYDHQACELNPQLFSHKFCPSPDLDTNIPVL